ncbi:MAG: EAL domain-containing protein [Microcoleaceae cyanobacterium]
MKDRFIRRVRVTTDRWYRLIAIVAAGFSICLGLVVIGAWHTRTVQLIQLIPDSPPVRYNTALMFLWSGLALLAFLKHQPRLTVILGGLVMLIGGLTLAEYGFRVDLGIDQLLMSDYITNSLYAPDRPFPHLITEPIQQFFVTVERPFPGRASPNAALGFTFIGTALFCLGSIGSRQRISLRRSAGENWAAAIAATLAAGSIGIGLIALLGYLARLGTAHTWRYLTGVAPPTALNLLILGIALLILPLRIESVDRLPRWFPFSAGFGVLMATLLLWQALLSWSYSLISQLPSLVTTEVQTLLIPAANIVLLGGLLSALLVMAVLYFNQQIHEQATLLLELNRDLEQSNSLFEATLEATADGILVLDAEGKRDHFNQQFVNMWRLQDSVLQRLPLENAPKMPPWILEQLQDPAAFLAATQRMIAQLELETFDVFELKDGRIFERYSRPQWLGDRPVGKVLSYRDVTERRQAENALRKSEERFHSFMNNSSTVAFMKDEQGRYVYVNRTLERIFKITLDFLEGKTDFDWLPAEIATEVRARDAAVLATNQSSDYLETVPTSDGTVYHWLTFKFPFEDGDGHRYVGGVAVDVTERRRMEEALFHEKELAQVTLHSIGDAVITTDVRGNIEYLNPVAESLTGWSQLDAQGLPLTQVFRIINEDTRAVVENPVEQALRDGHVVGLANHTVLISRDEREIAIDDSAAPIRDRNGQVVGAVLVFHDVTQTRTLSRQLSWQAIHDPLTGLINRREFEQRLEQAISNARIHNQFHGLCYLDLDQFKIVNDTCGHGAGDELLCQVAILLEGQIRTTDVLARLGGDEFGLLLHQCSLKQVVRIADALREKIQAFRFVWQDKTFAIGVSIGVVEIKPQRQNLTDLLSAADSACYAAKNKGRNCVHVFRADDQQVLQQQRDWAQQITTALEENRFRLYFQVIEAIAAPESQEQLCEVLLRLQDETGSLVLPMAFIPAAERYNLMHKVDRWVIHTLFRHWALLQNPEQSTPQKNPWIYAINLSGSSINDDQFIDFLQEQFAQYSVSPHLICFEITETVAIANLTKAGQLIRKLQELGCRLTLDDFGSGMAFNYLKTLPVDYLKIDSGFVRNIVDDPVDRAMVEAIARIGHLMGLKTIAKFVENGAILEQIKTLSVDYAQGHGIGRPYPAPIPTNTVDPNAVDLLGVAELRDESVKPQNLASPPKSPNLGEL